MREFLTLMHLLYVHGNKSLLWDATSVLHTMLNTFMYPLFQSLQQTYKEATLNISTL
jgi:hypothetical protein